ncbi:unnamed protein product [Chrysoparadoxa australica]
MSGNGNSVIVGSHKASGVEGQVARGAYIFVLGSQGDWQVEQQLLSSTPSSNVDSKFGSSVSMSYGGDRVAIGASGDLTDGGAVHVFSRSSGVWTREALLNRDGPQEADQFGHSLALNAAGERLLVGAPASQSGSGTLTVFSRMQTEQGEWDWIEEAILSTTTSQQLGLKLAVSSEGNRCISGAKDSNGTGAAYIFSRSSVTGVWTEEARLTPSGATTGNHFGGQVAMSNDGSRVLVGDFGHEGSAALAYIFQWGEQQGWVEETRITARDDEWELALQSIREHPMRRGGASHSKPSQLLSTGAAPAKEMA